MTMRRPALLGGGRRRGPGGSARAIVLLLPGGSIRSTRRPVRLAEWSLLRLRRMLAEQSADGIVTYLLRYRYRGWYAGVEAAATATDARWALAEIGRRHRDAPVVLVGNSLGGRAAVAVAGHPAVTAVAGVAPWLPPEVETASLAGRPFLVIHGSADRSEAPALWSLAFAERARADGVRTARFVVPADGHFLLRRHRDWAAAVSAFAVSAAARAPMPAALERAFAPGTGLSVPLPAAVAFGTSAAGSARRRRNAATPSRPSAVPAPKDTASASAAGCSARPTVGDEASNRLIRP